MFKYYFHKRPHSFLSTTNVWVCVTNDRTFNSAKAPAKEFQIQLLHFTQREKFHKHYWGHSKLKTHFELYTKWKEFENFVESKRTQKPKKELSEWMDERKEAKSQIVFVSNAMQRSKAWFGWTNDDSRATFANVMFCNQFKLAMQS